MKGSIDAGFDEGPMKVFVPFSEWLLERVGALGELVPFQLEYLNARPAPPPAAPGETPEPPPVELIPAEV